MTKFEELNRLLLALVCWDGDVRYNARQVTIIRQATRLLDVPIDNYLNSIEATLRIVPRNRRYALGFGIDEETAKPFCALLFAPDHMEAPTARGTSDHGLAHALCMAIVKDAIKELMPL